MSWPVKVKWVCCVALDQFDLGEGEQQLTWLREGPLMWLRDNNVGDYTYSVDSRNRKVRFGFPEEFGEKKFILFKLTWGC